MRHDPAGSEYDYIVVGGGTAGCVLAGRLGEEPGVSVLLVERGGPYSRLVLGVPLLGMRYLGRYDEVSWTVAQRHCLGRELRLQVARVLGGGSSINAMIYLRGEPRAYDRWVEQGAAGWGYADVLPYFRRMENFERGETAHHGVGGPIGISSSRYRSRFGEAFIEACLERGLSRNDDLAGPEPEGAGFYHYTQWRGERSTPAIGYLRAAGSGGNLDVRTEVEIDRLIIERGRAVGVQGRNGASPIRITARREVVLAAGALGSPRLLLLSGIGPADELRRVGIEPCLDLPGVGRGLQDHVRCPVLYLPKRPVPLSLPVLAASFLQWCFARSGPFASTTIAAGAVLKLDPSSPLLDCQLTAKWAGSPPHRNAVDFQPCLMDVESRGTVRLGSSDSTAPLLVDPNYLAAPRETGILVEAIRFARSLAQTEALGRFGLVRELLPGPGVRSVDELARYVGSSVETCFHPAGTCAMGTSPAAVVDPSLRVHGLEGLRVADASVMPSLVNANTNGPTIMIAEKAADLIRSSRSARAVPAPS